MSKTYSDRKGKDMKKLLLLALLFPFILVGCDKKEEEPQPEVKEPYINVSVTEVTLEEEQQYQIVTEILKKGTIVFYSSNNDEIATVTDDGLVTAVKAGETTINIRGGKDSYSLFVTVLPYQAHDSLQIVLEKEEFTLAVNDKYNLPLTVKYGNEIILNPALTYTYETQGIVSIEGIEVTAKAVGTTKCVVTATYNEEEVSKIFTVTVY